VLAGTVEQTADGIGVRVRLVDTETGDQLHTSSAHVSSNDRIALLDALADSVLRLVRTRLGDVVRDRMRLLETKQPAAFDRVVWATHRLKEFDLAFRQADYETAEDVLNDADSAFAAAERLDPQWLEPIVERGHLARPRARLARVRGDTSRIVPALQRGIAHAERALQLNPADARALQLRGELHHYHLQVAPPAQPAEADRIRDAAEHDLRASLIGNHYPAKPLRILSELAGSNGRMREALQHGERAYEADPFMDEVQYTVFRLFEYSFALRQDAAAARWCGEGRKRFALPTIVVFDDCRLALGAWSDAYPLTVDSAWTLVDAEVSAFHASQRTALEPRLHAMVAAVLIRHDNQDSARVLLRTARSRDASVGLLRAAAGAYGLLGEPDSALVMLQTLLQRTPAQRRALQHAVELRSVAADPRIRALLDASAATGR
jgi:tetratricopeptide (TPR) repeat protein